VPEPRSGVALCAVGAESLDASGQSLDRPPALVAEDVDVERELDVE
jgi:hypothetical protein